MQDSGGKRILVKVLFSLMHPEATIFLPSSEPYTANICIFSSLHCLSHMSHRIFKYLSTLIAKVADRKDDSSVINQVTTPRPAAADLGISLALSSQSFDMLSHCLLLTSLVVSLSSSQTSLKSPASSCSKIFFPPLGKVHPIRCQ